MTFRPATDAAPMVEDSL